MPVTSVSEKRILPPPILEFKPKSKNEELEEQVREKDKTIMELKNRKQDELQRMNNLLFESREFKKKSRAIIAKSILELA